MTSGRIMRFVLFLIMAAVAFFVMCFIIINAFIVELYSSKPKKPEVQPQPPPLPIITEKRLAIETIYRILGPKCAGMEFGDALRACEKVTHPDLGGKQSDFIAVQKARKILLG